MNLNFENPLVISLLVYIVICLMIYYFKPSFLMDNEQDDNQLDSKINKIDFFKRNKNVIFILLPFVIYGLSSIYVSNKTKNNYCKYLKNKNLKIKDLLQKCKA